MAVGLPVCDRPTGRGLRVGTDPWPYLLSSIRRCAAKVLTVVRVDMRYREKSNDVQTPSLHFADSTPLASRYAGWHGRIRHMAGLAASAGRYGAERRICRPDDVGGAFEY